MNSAFLLKNSICYQLKDLFQLLDDQSLLLLVRTKTILMNTLFEKEKRGSKNVQELKGLSMIQS